MKLNYFCVGVRKKLSWLESAAIALSGNSIAEEHKNIRTEKTENDIINHFNNIGMNVIFIRRIDLGNGEIAELI